MVFILLCLVFPKWVILIHRGLLGGLDRCFILKPNSRYTTINNNLIPFKYIICYGSTRSLLELDKKYQGFKYILC